MPLQFRRYFIALCMLWFSTSIHAQKVYYPLHSSDLLKSTAQDVADLFNRSIQGSYFTTEEYNALMPAAGIVLIYDPMITNNQSCKIVSTGTGNIKFSASQDNGLCFGIYTYLKKLGFRFYLPGSIWEKIPALASPYKNINEVVSGTFKYNNWFISGGCSPWAMDKNNSYSWENYSGNNGHEWAKYQRRNNMNGSNYFRGHREDIMNTEYLNTLKNNSCYVACYNGGRKAGYQSTPDINNNEAKSLWANTIQQTYSTYKNWIFAHQDIYANAYRNFDYYNQFLGIEVADGAVWGNSTDQSGCATGNYNGKPYPKESDQQFLLANYTAEKINSSFPEKQFQCYAYNGHADPPSAGITINNNIHVQVVPSAFQSETSTKGLLNRWYQKRSNISEYHYANIPQWTGETPMFSLSEYKNTLQRIKQKNGEGLVIEASPAKFATLPYLLAGNRYVLENAGLDSSLDEFADNMFPAEVSLHIKQLLKYWGDENIFTVSYYTGDNKYKIPLYLQELNRAIIASKNQNPEVVARLQELKAYLHYMVLYYDFITDKRTYQDKSAKAITLCIYLAKVNKMQLVNSYFLIQDILNKYPADNTIQAMLNVTNGSTYLEGNLPLITNDEINNNFSYDLSRYGNTITDYRFENTVDIISKLSNAGLKSLDKINVEIRYTNGWDYPQRSEFYLYAPSAGSFTINCDPHFTDDRGFINFVVEAADKPLTIISDVTVSAVSNPGLIKINIPEAGFYKLSYVSKYRTTSDLSIITNGNLFFRKGPFYGEKFENYRGDWESLPKYFYVPQGVSKLYFSINNSCSINCESSQEIQNSFSVKDNYKKNIAIEVSPADSSLYNIEVPAANAGKFWEVSRMNQYNLCFANITNMEIYAERKPAAGVPAQNTTGATSVYPNPSRGVFNFKNQASPAVFEKIDIYNNEGKPVKHFANTSSIDIAAMPAGIYFFIATSGTENAKGKLIKN